MNVSSLLLLLLPSSSSSKKKDSIPEHHLAPLLYILYSSFQSTILYHFHFLPPIAGPCSMWLFNFCLHHQKVYLASVCIYFIFLPLSPYVQTPLFHSLTISSYVPIPLFTHLMVSTYTHTQVHTLAMMASNERNGKGGGGRDKYKTKDGACTMLCIYFHPPL